MILIVHSQKFFLPLFGTVKGGLMMIAELSELPVLEMRPSAC